jgi:nucleoside-diphosphate-sugar epimerase
LYLGFRHAALVCDWQWNRIMPKAFIIGGTGQIGRATAVRLAADGWDVQLLSRHVPDDQTRRGHLLFDRDDPHALGAVLQDGADLLVDCLAFDAADADRLLAIQSSVGRIVAISSASVYCDAQGRTLDVAGEQGFPHYPLPITEAHPTVAPGPATYSSRKAAMEQRLLQQAHVPVTILRPCAIHGAHSAHAREWWFVKRLRDGRTRIPLAYGGSNQFHTTSATAIAEAIMLAAHGQIAPIVNVTDADAPTVNEIGQAIMAAMAVQAEFVLLPDTARDDDVGKTPWSVPSPLVLQSSLPPHLPYARSVIAAVDWLVTATTGKDWRSLIPQLAAYPRDHFDYAAEDAMFAA